MANTLNNVQFQIAKNINQAEINESFGLSRFEFPPAVLSKYHANSTGKCMVSFIVAEHDGLFYIIDTENCLESNLYNEKLTNLDKIPPPGHVFAINLEEGGLCRAVRDNNTFGHKQPISLLLIDTGETMEIDPAKIFSLFSLSPRAQKMSARGIPCKLIEMYDENGIKNDIKTDLFRILYEMVYFRIKKIENGIMFVNLYQTEPLEFTPFASKETMELTKEQMDILYEEPVNTTNALKAVMGYVPQDDKRICQFYDPVTKRCFKGNNCRFEHVEIMKDGWTRDRDTIKYKVAENIMPPVDSTVNIIITSVVSVDEFYAYIPDMAARSGIKLDKLKEKVNCEEYSKRYKKMNRLPAAQELILAKYKGKIFRGRVIEIDYNKIVVFLVDYGSTIVVDLNDLYEWSDRWDYIPFQAYRCYLENVCMRKANDSQAIAKFRNHVLRNPNITANIIQSTDDLHVRLVDGDGYDIGELMCVTGLAEVKKKIVPSNVVNNMIPG